MAYDLLFDSYLEIILVLVVDLTSAVIILVLFFIILLAFLLIVLHLILLLPATPLSVLNRNNINQQENTIDRILILSLKPNERFAFISGAGFHHVCTPNIIV